MITFDPTVTSSDYLDQARSDPSLPGSLRCMTQPDFDFGLNQQNLAALLDPANWRRTRPGVLISAEWNSRSNIRVNWHPHSITDFHPVDRRELFWFKGFKQALENAQMENSAAILLIYAHVARFNEIVREVSSKVEIVRWSRIVPFYEFNVDIRPPDPSVG